MNETQEIRRKRLQYLIDDRFDGNASALARAVDRSPDYVRFLLHPDRPGGRNIGERIARHIEAGLGLPPGWLDKCGDAVETVREANYLLVPRLDVQVSAGAGLEISQGKPLTAIAFRREWLDKRALRPEDVEVYTALGDSMDPYIRNGDAVLVDVSDRLGQPENGEVWVVYQEGRGVRIKRLFFTDGGDLVLRSDNADKAVYPDEVVPFDQASTVRILGRVIWRAG